MKRTNLYIPVQLHKTLKMKAAALGLPMGEIAVQLLKKYLRGEITPVKYKLGNDLKALPLTLEDEVRNQIKSEKQGELLGGLILRWMEESEKKVVNINKKEYRPKLYLE